MNEEQRTAQEIEGLAPAYMRVYEVGQRLLEPMLGTVPKDKSVYTTYIAAKAIEQGIDPADELETVPDIASDEERGWTGFHTLADGTPILYSYMVKGCLKSAAKNLRRNKASKISKVRAYRKLLAEAVFIYPRQIPVVLADEMGWIERPLRAETPQGERVALARSDTIPAGSSFSFQIHVLGDEITEDILKELLSYGQYQGYGQWRTAGYGRALVTSFKQLHGE